MVEGARLESEYTAKPYRGFESLPLRHFSLISQVKRRKSTTVPTLVPTFAAMAVIDTSGRRSFAGVVALGMPIDVDPCLSPLVVEPNSFPEHLNLLNRIHFFSRMSRAATKRLKELISEESSAFTVCENEFIDLQV